MTAVPVSLRPSLLRRVVNVQRTQQCGCTPECVTAVPLPRRSSDEAGFDQLEREAADVANAHDRSPRDAIDGWFHLKHR